VSRIESFFAAHLQVRSRRKIGSQRISVTIFWSVALLETTLSFSVQIERARRPGSVSHCC